MLIHSKNLIGWRIYKGVVLIILALRLVYACGPPGHKNNTSEPIQKITLEQSENDSWNKYNSRDYLFSMPYPNEWEVREFNLGNQFPVINIFPDHYQDSLDLPLRIHTRADVTYIADFPRGYGTEFPSGRSAPLNHDSILQLDFAVDQTESKAFVLENGSAWGYFIVPSSPPDNWGRPGFIFAQIAVSDFEPRCLDKNTGRELDMAECNPLMGDTVKRYGSVNNPHKKLVGQMLSDIKFTNQKSWKDSMYTDEIQVSQPEQGAAVNSPVQIKGSARGSWYFEAQFTVKLVQNDQFISEAIVNALGDWMTSNFVPFTATLEYPSRYKGDAELVFQNSNASGKPELDKEFRLPVFLQ